MAEKKMSSRDELIMCALALISDKHNEMMARERYQEQTRRNTKMRYK